MSEDRRNVWSKAHNLCREILELSTEEDTICVMKESDARTSISIQKHGVESTSYHITKSKQTVLKNIDKDQAKVSTNKKRTKVTEPVDETAIWSKECEEPVYQMNSDPNTISTQNIKQTTHIINVKEASEPHDSESLQAAAFTEFKKTENLPQSYEASIW